VLPSEPRTFGPALLTLSIPTDVAAGPAAAEKPRARNRQSAAAHSRRFHDLHGERRNAERRVRYNEERATILEAQGDHHGAARARALADLARCALLTRTSLRHP